jgi:hypothetical protein
MSNPSRSILDDDEFWDYSALTKPVGVAVDAQTGLPSDTTNPYIKPPPRDPLDPIEQAIHSFEPTPDIFADPHMWGLHRLGEFFWSKQVEILLSIRKHRYTAVKSCHDAGKSFIAARAAIEWMDEYEPGEAFIVSTAPTSAQVTAILWREIQRAHGKAAFQGKITTAGYPQWKVGGEIVGYGRKPAEYTQAAFTGIHARYVLVLVDEACGISADLFNAVDALVTNENARVLAIGNPDDPTAHFATICKPSSGWNVIRIDGLATPNFTEEAVLWLDCPICEANGRDRPLLADLYEQEGIPYSTEYIPDSLRDLLLSPLWVEERLHRWVGVPSETATIAELANKSALFVSKVRGLFPESGTEGIIPLGWVELAMQRHEEWVASGSPQLYTHAIDRDVIGADIGDTGEDATVLALRHGAIVQELRTHRTADTMEAVGYIKAALTGRPGSLAIVDSIGIGAGVLSRLREQGEPVMGFVASGSATGITDKTGEFKFRTLRGAAWWRMRELLDPSQPGGSKVMLPRSEVLLGDLTTPHWKVLSGGTIWLEPKEEIRKRLGRSTDEGDAVVMSFWQGRGTVDAGEVTVLSWWDESDGSAIPWGVDEMAAIENGSGGSYPPA